jgi:hypothetical protein
MAVFFGKPTTPFAHNSGSYPIINMSLKLVAAYCEELRTVVKSCIFNSARSETTTNAATFVENCDVVSAGDAFTSGHESGKTSANNNDSHCQTATDAA